MAQDFNGPSSQILAETGYPILDASYVFGFDLRPTGTRALDIGVEATWLQAEQPRPPTRHPAIDIPGLGRARADIQVNHLPNDAPRAVVGTAGLEIYVGHASAGGGILAGSGLGGSSAVGEYLTASVADYVNPGLPKLSRAVWLRLEDTPGTRDHVALLRALWEISEKPDIKAVTLILRTESALHLGARRGSRRRDSRPPRAGKEACSAA